jgi:hypothetical protein
MMPSFVLLLAAYGICFGVMNKLSFLYGRMDFIDRLVSCSYCVGFHTGWMIWSLSHLAGVMETSGPFYFEIPLWGLSTAAFCYGADALLRLVESHTTVEDEVEVPTPADVEWLPDGVDHIRGDGSFLGEA